MSQILNQFNQAPIKGMTDLKMNNTIISCVVGSASAGGLVPGQAVTIVNTDAGIPTVVEAAADTSDVFGFLTYGIKDVTYEAGDRVEVVIASGSVLYMEASAAVVPYAQLMILVAGSKVLTATGSGKMVVGRALDKAAASGDLIRVLVSLPAIALP